MLAIVPRSLTIKYLGFLHKKPNKQFLTTDYAHDIVPGNLHKWSQLNLNQAQEAESLLSSELQDFAQGNLVQWPQWALSLRPNPVFLFHHTPSEN